MTPQEKFNGFRSHANSVLIERDDEIELVLLGLLTGQNICLIGPPGTAKSMLANMLVKWIGGEKFSILMTKYTMPEEVFGPIDVQAMTKGVYRRITKGKLPEATICFLDEIWKSSSAIANTLLEILNEGTFRNNGNVVKCPLRCCVACSNETPNSDEGGQELAAMFDRFLLRKHVNPITTGAGVSRLLWDDISLDGGGTITNEELDSATASVASVKWSKEAKEAYLKILLELASDGIIPGDRRRRLSVGVCKASAWLEGESEVQPDHLGPLAHTLWVDPEEQPRKVRKVVAKLANPASLVVAGLLEEVAEVISESDVKDFEKSVTSLKKLGEIQDKLRDIKGRKAVEALDYVTASRREISEVWAK